jgi:hypothetical protein
MQICEDPYKCSCLLAGLEGSPWSCAVRTNKGRHTVGLRKDCLTCCCTSGCRLHVSCRVFRSGTALEWHRSLMRERMHPSSPFRIKDIRNHTVDTVVYRHMERPSWRDDTCEKPSYFRLQFSTLRPFYKVRHRKSNCSPPPPPQTSWGLEYMAVTQTCKYFFFLYTV